MLKQSSKAHSNWMQQALAMTQISLAIARGNA